MTVLIVVDGGAPLSVPVPVPAGDEPASSAGSSIMELDSPNAPELSATRIRSIFSPGMMLRDIAVSDADMLAWGRALPRYPDAGDMIDLDI